MKLSVVIILGIVLCVLGYVLYWLMVRPLRIHKEAEPFREEMGKKLAKIFRLMFAAVVKDRFVQQSVVQKIDDGICASTIFVGNGPQCLSAECLCDLLAYFVSIREIEPDQFHTKQYVLETVEMIREIVRYPYENCSSVAVFQGYADSAHDRLDLCIKKLSVLHA